MINWSSEVLLLTLAFSVGYFIYDAVDMYVNNPKTSTYQLLGHHFCVIVCFAIRYVSIDITVVSREIQCDFDIGTTF